MSDFPKLTAEITAAPGLDQKLTLLIGHIRRNLDYARSHREWDAIEGLSQQLGGFTDNLIAAMRDQDEPRSPPASSPVPDGATLSKTRPTPGRRS